MHIELNEGNKEKKILIQIGFYCWFFFITFSLAFFIEWSNGLGHHPMEHENNFKTFEYMLLIASSVFNVT